MGTADKQLKTTYLLSRQMLQDEAQHRRVKGSHLPHRSAQLAHVPANGPKAAAKAREAAAALADEAGVNLHAHDGHARQSPQQPLAKVSRAA
jgi:hypothetical protein